MSTQNVYWLLAILTPPLQQLREIQNLGEPVNYFASELNMNLNTRMSITFVVLATLLSGCSISLAQDELLTNRCHMTVRCVAESVRVGDPLFVAIEFENETDLPVFPAQVLFGLNIKIDAIATTGQTKHINQNVKPLWTRPFGCSLSPEASKKLPPKSSRVEVVLIDPWSSELIDYVIANSVDAISLRTTVGSGIAWTVASYSPFRFDMPIAKPILDVKDLGLIETTTNLLPTVSPGQAEQLATSAPDSTLYRNLMFGREISKLLAGDLSHSGIDQELGKLLDSVPNEVRTWYRSEMLKIVQERRPAVYHFVLSEGNL